MAEMSQKCQMLVGTCGSQSRGVAPICFSLANPQCSCISVSPPEKLYVSSFNFYSEFRKWAEFNDKQTTMLLEESAL